MYIYKCIIPVVHIVYKFIYDFCFFVHYVEKCYYDLTNPLYYDIMVT